MGKIKKIGKKLVFLLNNFGTWQYLLIFCNLSRVKGYWARRGGGDYTWLCNIYRPDRHFHILFLPKWVKK